MSDAMQAGDPAVLVERLFEALATGRIETLDELLAVDCVDAQPVPFQGPGRAGIALKLALFRARFPGFVSTLTALAAAGDTAHGEAEATWTTQFPDGQLTRWRGRFRCQAGQIAAFEVAHVA